MDSGWPLHSLENKHLVHEPKDFDLNVPQNEPLDMNLGFNATTTNYGQSQSNPSQVPITQNHYGSIDASYSQGTNTIPSSSMLIPGYYDCMNQCFIPSAAAAAAAVPPVNNYPMIIGGSGDIPRLEPGSSLGHDHQWQVHNCLTPVRRCANCHTTETPMWRRGPGGPKSLCNACGIKDRKEREKRKAEESVMMSQNRRN